MLFDKVGTVAARPASCGDGRPRLSSIERSSGSFFVTSSKRRHYLQPLRMPLQQFDKLKQPIQKPT
jgi:hypothetical protein